MARLLPHDVAASAFACDGCSFWNLGVLLGVGGILAGDSTGYDARVSGYSAIVLSVAYLLT